MKLNRDRHEAHRTPPRANLEQRIAWHLAHREACPCRPIPPKLLAELEQRGLTGPPRSV